MGVAAEGYDQMRRYALERAKTVRALLRRGLVSAAGGGTDD